MDDGQPCQRTLKDSATAPKGLAQGLAEGLAALDVQLRVIGAHASIGRYIAVFSLIPAAMRDEIVLMAAGDDSSAELRTGLLHTVLSKMTADPLRSAFFAMAAQIGDLNDADHAIRTALQAEVQFQIALRNDVAHADWYVGILHPLSGELLPNEAKRIKVTREGGPQFVVLPLDDEVLGEEADRAFHLANCCRAFGLTCRKQEEGPYQRPSDALEVFHDPRAGRRRVRLKPEVLQTLSGSNE